MFLYTIEDNYYLYTIDFTFPVCLWILLGVHGDRCARGSSEEQDGETDRTVRAATDGLQRKMGYVMGQVGYIIGKNGSRYGNKWGQM